MSEKLEKPLYRRENIMTGMVVHFVAVHVLGIYGLHYAFSRASTAIIVSAVVYFFLCHLAITVGAHRAFTHRAFSMKNWLAYLLAALFTANMQSPLWQWCVIHSQHHPEADGPNDPHSPHVFCIGRSEAEHVWWRKALGFLHAQMGWAMLRSSYQIKRQYKNRFVGPKAHQAVRWQAKHHRLLTIVMVGGVPLVIGLAFGDVWGALLVIGAARLMCQYHLTWIVNSLGHLVGEQVEESAHSRNFAVVFGLFGRTMLNLILAILTVGEVWHANHHISERHWQLGRRWWQIDPGGFIIRVLSCFGVVYNLQSPAERRFVPTASCHV